MPWSHVGGPSTLAGVAPEVARALDRVLARRPNDRVAEAVTAIPALTLGLPPLQPAKPEAAGPIGAVAEQFALDVSQITDEQRATLGDRAFELAMAMYVGDFVPRVRTALDALFTPGDWTLPRRHPGDRWAAIDELQRAIARLDALDPVTTELVRLRGARQHQCRLCQSLRSRSAIVAGADDATFAAVDHHAASDLDDAQKAALALTDALIWTPAHLPHAVLDHVRAHFTAAQATELVLDVFRNAGNKIAVALAADAPHVSEGVEIYDINPDGTLAYGLSAP